MSDREHAAALADDLSLWCRNDVDPTDSDLILAALRAYAARPEPQQDLREVVAAAILPVVLRVRRDFRGINANEGASLIAFAALSAICVKHAIVPKEPSEAAVARAISTASERAYSDEAGLHRTFEVPTHASMRAALVEYGEKGND